MSDVDEVRRALQDAQSASAQAQDDAGTRPCRACALRRPSATPRRGPATARRLSAPNAGWRPPAAPGKPPTLPIADAREQLAAGLELAVPVIDPRRLVERLSADFPVLLFPVRLETRFMAVTNDAGARTEQLWVRIFPDTCSIDSFGADLTQSEVEDAQVYWRAVWAAAGDVDAERAAWRVLVVGHGSGRATWLVASVQPTNPEQRRRSPAIRRPSRRSTLSTPCRRRGTGPRERRCCPNGSCW